MKRHGIDKAMRLRRRQDFLAVQGSGTKIHGRAFLALVAPTPVSPAEPAPGVVASGHAAGVAGGVAFGRVGVTVTRRVGNAVTRNRIKRLVREWLRLHGWVPAGRDVVIVAKEAAAGVRSLEDVAGDLQRIRARIPC